MKNINLGLILLFIFSTAAFSQKGKWQDEEAREKFEQLEKIKLIETLEMDEETTLRFFSRQLEHRKQQDEIQEEIRAKIDDLDVTFKSGRVATTEEIKSSINEINTLQLQFDKNRVDFINSLSDILSYEQIAKLIIFEKRFRNELRKLLIRERRPPMDPE
ncbi:MAG: hypothetical protein OQK57_01185 [Ignavibacteriaceae bacterium]|nr:hypothetical protein [Ignavibacteriaceae bacterium]